MAKLSLQRFSETKSNKVRLKQRWHRRLVGAAYDTFWEYAERTKVNGIWLLRRNRTQGLSRWIWSTVLASLFIVGIYLSLQLWFKFYSYPILDTISNEVSITDVAFPGVSICSPKVVNMQRVDKFVRNLKLPDKMTVSEVAESFDYMEAFTDQSWVPPPNISFAAADSVLRYNNISVFQAAKLISAGCKEFVKTCFWGTMEFPCKDFFLTTTSYLGPCCSFNYNPMNSSYVPFAANIFGIDGGLTFIGEEGSETNRSTGLIVIIHHPKDFITEASAAVTITTNSESFVEITPIVQSSSKEVLELSEKKRDCLTSDDLQLQNYRQSYCLLTCQAKEIFKKCHCSPYHMPNNHDYRECGLNDTLCYASNYEKFKSVKCAQCLPNCYDFTYSTISYKTDLMLHNFSVSKLYTNRNFTDDSFIVRVYLSRQVVPAIRKVTVMSWIGLLSDLGGVFNLCLGLSVISLVEFCYYCTYRFYSNFKRQDLQGTNTNTNNPRDFLQSY